jgi:protoporphyrinogen oxidase
LPDGVIILGGGLAGLSTAYHIGKGCQVFEAEDFPGGLLRTRVVDGYSFDCTGHLLHLKDPYARGLVTGLMNGNIKEHTRRAAIYSKGVFTGYPFQANTYGLPDETARECLEGFENAPGRRPGAASPGNFRDWVTHNFGVGIARHFMLPYNGKLWQYDLASMSVDGVEPYVPVPSVEEVRRGTTEEGARGLGYNAKFFYPESGGIESFVRALLPHVRDLSLGQRAELVDTERKTVTFKTGYTAWYDTLVSTVPLPVLVGMIKDVPVDIADAAKKLRYVSVYDVNLGVARADLSPYHWIYFPEEEYPFYRVGFCSNFSPAMAPAGCSSVYVEVSHKPDEQFNADELAGAARNGLVRCGILKAGDEVPVKDVLDIRYAYVVFDAHYKAAVPAIHRYLESKGIISIGRYGGWEYSSMEDAILEGRRTAGKLT